MDDELLEMVSIWMMLYMIIFRRRRNSRWRNRRWLVRPINQNRAILGDHSNLLQELKEDTTLFYRYTRMDVGTFEHLLQIVSPYLMKNHPRGLEPELRLIIALRYNIHDYM